MAVTVTKSEQGVSREATLELQLKFQKRLNNITNKIHSAKDTNDILLNLQNEILEIFDADRITIYVVDGLNKQIVSRLKTGSEMAEIRVPIDNSSLSGYCAASGKMINVKNAYDNDELKTINPELGFNKSFDKKSGFKTTQVLVAPIIYNKYLLGVIQLINKKDNSSFTVEDQNSVLEIAKVLGLAFFNNQKILQKKKPTKYDFLIVDNIITEKDLEKAMAEARKLKKPVENVLMSEFNVLKDDIGKTLSEFYKTRFIPYDDKMIIPGDLLKGVKANFLRHNVFVPVSRTGDKIVVAMENPDFLPARDTVKRLLSGKEFEYCVSLKDDIYQMIDLFYNVKRSDFLESSGSIEELLGKLGSEDDYDTEEIEAVSEEDGFIVQLVNKMIVDGYHRNASDIHIEPRPGRSNSVIRFRIDGACQVYQTIPPNYRQAIVSRIKIMSDLDISERRLPQDGKIRFKKYAPLDLELRVATIPTAGGTEDVVMRLLATGDPIPLEKMGMSDRNYKVFIEMISKPYGIVLCVGPTGSGKTTTLHAALRYINKPETKIWTAEDPVEITQDGLRQVQVHPKIGFDFATAMRAFLRADPDVIMVGEMRDHETVATGIEASLTGHLVFSTLHTNSAPETITRLLDMGMDPFNFADALLGVLAQRLCRTLCKDCKKPYHPSREEYDYLVRSYEGDFDKLGFPYNDDLILYKANGCSKCGNTGYRGRIGLHELIVGTTEMQNKIQVRARMDEVRDQAIKDGMTTLMQDGIRKVFMGDTDFMQVRKVCIK